MFLGAAPSGVAQGTLSGASERFAVLQPARSKTFMKGSADPDDRPNSTARGNDDGFSGLNGAEAFRENVSGSDAAILADVQGRAGFMGLLFRNFWSGAVGVPLQPIEDNRTQILVDGIVLSDMPLSSYFRNENDPLGQVPPFTGPWTGNRAGGFLTHTPIHFERNLKVRVFENSFSNAGRFHRVAWTTADPEGNVDVPDLTGWEQVVRRRGGWRHSVPRNPSAYRLDIPPSGSSIIHVTGPGAILEFRAHVDDPAAWSRLRARFHFDGRNDVGVDMPLRMLGAAGEQMYARANDSLLFGNDGSQEIWNYFPMPFAESASLEIVNSSGVETGLDVTVSTWSGAYPQPWGYFTTTWNRSVTQFGVPFQGPQLTNCRGVLRAIVLEDIVDTSGRIPQITDMAHLEGDLCVRINGLRGDEHTFEASETSVGKWGWYLTPSDVPFSADGSFNTSVVVAFPAVNVIGVGRRMGSTLVFDPMQFVDGIRIVMEHGIQNTSNADYGLMCMFYVQPGAARDLVGELDVGNAQSESNWNVQYGSAPASQVTTSFFRDQYFGDSPVTDDVRQVQDWFRFRVGSPTLSNYNAIGLGFRLDRMRTGTGGVCQARVFVDGYFAGLLHTFTTNPLEHWKEGGETEVELPIALTAGKSAMTIEIRPVAGTEPLRIGRARVYGYRRD